MHREVRGCVADETEATQHFVPAMQPCLPRQMVTDRSMAPGSAGGRRVRQRTYRGAVDVTLHDPKGATIHHAKAIQDDEIEIEAHGTKVMRRCR